MTTNPKDGIKRNGVSLPFAPVGAHTQNASLSSAATITVPGGATQWMVQALTQNVNFTLDGTTATSTIGFTLTAGNPVIIVPVYPGQTISAIEIAATATLKYQFGA